MPERGKGGRQPAPTVGGRFAAKDVGGGVPDAPGGVKTPPYDAKDKGAAMARLRAGHARPLRTAVSGIGGSGEHPNFKSEQRARALSANSNTAFA